MHLPDRLRPFWARFFKYDWTFGLALILLFGVVRFALVMNANMTGSYQLVSLVFVLMILTPWIFLTRMGRIGIGMVKAKNPKWLLYGFSSGILVSVLIYFLGDVLFADTLQNWYVYIARSYPAADDGDPYLMFGIVALVSMTFSQPIKSYMV